MPYTALSAQGTPGMVHSFVDKEAAPAPIEPPAPPAVVAAGIVPGGYPARPLILRLPEEVLMDDLEEVLFLASL